MKHGENPGVRRKYHGLVMLLAGAMVENGDTAKGNSAVLAVIAVPVGSMIINNHNDITNNDTP